MKLKHLAAFLTAAVTLAVPLAGSGFASAALAADTEPAADTETPAGTETATVLPDWIPTDFDAALEFRNTYGATHIADGLVCIVFTEDPAFFREKEGEPPRYQTVTTEDVMTEVYHRSFFTEESPYTFETVVYLPAAAGEFEVALVDTWIKGGGLDLGYSHAVAHYTFETDEQLNVTETDLFGWMPDCIIEYCAYRNMNSAVSVRENYVVFCLERNAGSQYEWAMLPRKDDCFEWAEYSDCSELSAALTDGGSVCAVNVYKAVKDGCAKISYELSAVDEAGEAKQTVTADCAVLNNAQTVLLPGQMQVTLTDRLTGALIPLAADPVTLNTPAIWTDVVYHGPEGDLTTGPVYSLGTNPAVLKEISGFFSADSFSFTLHNLPEGYSLPEDAQLPGYNNGTVLPEGSLKVTRFENGAADVVFRLKKTAPGASGDLNGDGEFSIADAVILQKWLIGESVEPFDWQAADFYPDGRLNAVDFALMKQALLAQMRGAVVAVRHMAAGGFVGKQFEYTVYEEDGKYFFSNTGRGYSNEEPQIIEIPREQYRAVMDFDYDSYLYSSAEEPVAFDGISYTTVLTYEDGSKLRISRKIPLLTQMLALLASVPEPDPDSTWP